ncbi:hypothetical protein [Microbacterium aureliae]
MARPARPDDADEEILEHGIHFRYLVIGDGGQLYSSPEAPPEAPAKIVVDADSFLEGELRREQVGTQGRREGGFEFIGVRTMSPAPSIGLLVVRVLTPPPTWMK